MTDDERKSNEYPTMPSARPRPTSTRPAGQPPRKLSGTMLLRFDEAMKKLEEPAKKLDEVRQKARSLCTDEEKAHAFDTEITGVFDAPPVAEEGKKEKK